MYTENNFDKTFIWSFTSSILNKYIRAVVSLSPVCMLAEILALCVLALMWVLTDDDFGLQLCTSATLGVLYFFENLPVTLNQQALGEGNRL